MVPDRGIDSFVEVAVDILDYATFAPIMQLKNETFHVGMSLSKPIRDKFPSLFHIVVLGSLKSFLLTKPTS